HHLAERLGVERLAQARRALQVREDDRHDLSRLLWRPRLGELRAAREAEPRNVRVLGAASRTDLHAASLRTAVGRSRRTCDNAPVAVPADALAHAAELDRRDTEIANELEVVRDLEERVGAIRGRAGGVRQALERVPLEREDLDRRRIEADEAVTAAHADVDRTESRVASLEAGRRKRDDELGR